MASDSTTAPPGILAAARRGEDDAQAKLPERRWPAAYRTAFSILCDHHLAEDVAPAGTPRDPPRARRSSSSYA